MSEAEKKGKGWHGDSEGHRRVAHLAGEARKAQMTPEAYAELGRKAGLSTAARYDMSERGRAGGLKSAAARAAKKALEDANKEPAPPKRTRRKKVPEIPPA